MPSIGSRSLAVPPVAGSAGSTTPLWFGRPGRPLSGWVHAPAGNVARGAAVLCAPLAYEQDVARYTFRRLAQELAARGVLTVRFDYDGTGDSTGSDEDPGRVDAWLASIAQAAALARRCGAASVVLVGMRAGALLAASAARASRATGLVAWDPCKSGRSHVREQHALQRLQFGEVDSRDGEIEVPGFVLSADTARALGQLEPDLLESAVSRALVLTRPGETVPPLLDRHLSGCDVEVDKAGGQELLLEGTGAHQQIPLVAIDRIATWVDESFPPASTPVTVPAHAPQSLRSDTGDELIERAVRIGPSRLFCIETVGAAGSDGPTVIFINNAFGSHVGPSRLWVLLARRWAAAGLRCIRLDLSGIGESPSRDGQPEHVVRSPVAFDDLSDATRALCPADPTNVVLVGLCAGGYQALEAAVALKTRGACVVNPVLRFRPPELEDGPIDPRRRLCHPTTTVSRVARRLPDLPLINGPRIETWREVGFGGAPDPENSWVHELVESHVDTLCICGEEEARAIALEMSATRRHDGFEVQILPGLDHALLVAAQRAEVVDRLTSHVVGRFAPKVACTTRKRHDDKGRPNMTVSA
jgi:alpha-beta hydrolase superfamily lysophospholipase